MWVHEQGLGSEKSLLEWWNEPNHARIEPFKKSAFLDLERERERSKHGGAWVALSSASEGQGPWLACPEI